MKALVSLTRDSLILLIPQLEEWVLQDATPTPVERKGHESVDLDPWCPDRRYRPDTVAIEDGSREGVRVSGGGFGSIKGLYQAPNKMDAGQKGKSAKSRSESQEEHREAFRVCPVLKESWRDLRMNGSCSSFSTRHLDGGSLWITEGGGFGATFVNRKCAFGVMFGT